MGYKIHLSASFYTPSGIKRLFISITRYTVFVMETKKKNPIAIYIKENRRKAGLIQKEFALRSGLGLRFVRELEQGKESLRMDKVNQALYMFGMEAVPGRIPREDIELNDL